MKRSSAYLVFGIMSAKKIVQARKFRKLRIDHMGEKIPHPEFISRS
jgi:hypothetical protein